MTVWVALEARALVDEGLLLDGHRVVIDAFVEVDDGLDRRRVRGLELRAAQLRREDLVVGLRQVEGLVRDRLADRARRDQLIERHMLILLLHG